MFRYPETHGFTTTRDVLSDLVVQLEFLRSFDYCRDLLISRHNVPATDAAHRAKRVRPYAEVAAAYLRQAGASTPDVAFLPGYYAILNLLKIYILFSRFHTQLDSKLQHGASYAGFLKDSQSLLTEVVTIHPAGAISLAYGVITDCKLTHKRSLSLRELLPYMQDIAFEWDLACPHPAAIAMIKFTVSGQPGAQQVTAEIHGVEPARVIPARQLQVLRGFKPAPTPHQYQTGPLAGPLTGDALIRSQIRPCLLYYPNDRIAGTPISARHLLLPEELPTTLVFYYLSSVARYKPEFLAKLRDSRFWAPLATATYHSLQKILLLCLSYVHQRNFMVS
jgi:hypothetical protein